MDSKEIREGYLKFFESKGHLRMKSSSLIPQDSTLLFTVAGMVPLKWYFLGEEVPPSTRITTVQKCLRTNDIEKVGVTKSHQTFFEMLGNFSIGDYFKDDAIHWAFEFSTEFLKLPVSKLWVTIYKDDAETREIWNRVGIPDARIVPLGEEDNFWTMGPVGPCGPCSEIYFDRGAKTPEEEKELPGGNGERFLEFWNLVFTQFDRQQDGTLLPLPRKNIDTGMGLERITSIIEDTDSDFETDIFLPIIKEIERTANKTYHSDAFSDRNFKAIADHIRAITFLIADGLIPSNEKRGYVLRRLIRRAELFGRNLGLSEPFLFSLTSTVVENFKSTYEELKPSKEIVSRVVKEEENRFNATLNSGFTFFNEAFEELKEKNTKEFPAESVFYLSDTLGFPVELSEMLIEEKGFTFDKKHYNALLDAQRGKARLFIEGKDSYNEKLALSNIKQEVGNTIFVGYNETASNAIIVGIVKNGELVTEAFSGDEVSMILDKTPFYAEKGGQVGDTGKIVAKDFEFEVQDTQSPVKGLILHIGKINHGTVKVKEKCVASVDEPRRHAIMRAHTSTHILQAALRNIFGETVRQQGSEVKPDEFRFDFNFNKTLSEEMLLKIERLMNEIILQSHQVNVTEMDIDEAKNKGALAFFEEKYGNKVRVVDVEGISKELCGGTHVTNTSQIGSVTIISSRTVASGVKRIEGFSGELSYNYFSSFRSSLRDTANILDVTEDALSNKLKALISELKESERYTKELLLAIAYNKIVALKPALLLNNVPIYAVELEDTNLDDVRKVFDIAKKHIKEGFVVIVSPKGNQTFILVGKISGDVSATELFKKISEKFNIKGGGSDRLAQGSTVNKISVNDVLSAFNE
jgi:alanyl-tRNA synthetase